MRFNFVLKIAFVVSRLIRGGPTSHLFNLISYAVINKKNVEIYIITLSDDHDIELLEKFLSLGVNYINLDLTRVQFLFNGHIKLYKIISKFNIDIVHSQGVRCDYICSRLSRFILTITTVHNEIGFGSIHEYGLLRGLVYTFLHLVAISRIKRIVSCSWSVSNNLKKYMICSEVINNGVDTFRFRLLDEAEKNIIKSQLEISIGKPIFIYLGRLVYLKRIAKLVEIFSKLDNDLAYLLILGDGPELLKCKHIAKKNENIIFFGHVTNPEKYLGISDYIVSLSKTEGLPLSVLEAISSGCYPVLSNIPAHRSLIEQLDGFGMLVDDFNDIEKFICSGSESVVYKKSVHDIHAIRSIIEVNRMSKSYFDLYETIYSNEE